jgi:Na+/citrate or Na+/malate symporter
MSLPLLILLFAAVIGIAWLTELPAWMVGVGAVLALIGFLLERRRE